jgi:hypothetical protein
MEKTSGMKWLRLTICMANDWGNRKYAFTTIRGSG